MSPLNKAGMYSSDDVALAETIERLIKFAWRYHDSRALLPALILTTIKHFIINRPTLVLVYADLFVDDDNAHLGMSTYQHLLQYIMSELHH
ncbi:hypothetical protein [Vibrio alginolyticus]|uniref:hypothetical protein n=1 Tax=Vibrio alginolyticus TaxID=663 RepID=UPI0015F3F020|nr:hypothetical protein [Vibrio alginolyticus]